MLCCRMNDVVDKERRQRWLTGCNCREAYSFLRGPRVSSVGEADCDIVWPISGIVSFYFLLFFWSSNEPSFYISKPLVCTGQGRVVKSDKK